MTLKTQVERYIEFKRRLGYKYVEAEKTASGLRELCGDTDRGVHADRKQWLIGRRESELA